MIKVIISIVYVFVFYELYLIEGRTNNYFFFLPYIK